MKIALEYETGGPIVIIAYCTNAWQGDVEVARGRGDKLEEAARELIGRFAEMQRETIDALLAAGIIKGVRHAEEGPLS